jgi:benzoyl-CoA reductase/2-hydroxyglutaryl-CoA dehydratase subunit BcrC/BadD/HgdB
LLKELLAKIETVKKRDDKRIKIVVAGHPCSVPDQALLKLIEDAGMVVVDDDLFAGGRSFATDVKQEGDAMEAFADYYMNSIPCTTYHYPDRWTGHAGDYSAYADYICDIVKSSDARGLILLKVKYCDPFDMEFVLLKEVLEKRNVPYLVLQTEIGKGALEAIRTRVDAFREMLQNTKGTATK